MRHEVQIELLIGLVRILVIFGALLTLFSAVTYLERRLLAFMQFRLGPNRTGPFGLFQPVADGIKLFFKEEVIPDAANRWVFLAAPGVSVVVAIMAMAVVPWGGTLVIAGRPIPLQIADLGVGVLYIFAVASLGVYGLVLAGWSSNNKFALLGGLRSSAQMFSYELALGLSWVGVILLVGSFRLQDIVAAQAGGIWRWHFVAQFPAFIIYLIAATAEVNRIPFDLPEGETELVAGFHTEYSSMRFALFQMAEYLNMFTVAALATNLFLGGWNGPLGLVPPDFMAHFAPGRWLASMLFAPATALYGFFGLGWFLLKVLSLIFMFIWLRGTLPRFRYDQLMSFGWKVLVPAASLWILVTAGAVTWRLAGRGF